MNILKYIIVLVLCILLSLVMWIFSKNFLTGLLSGAVIYISFLMYNLFRSTQTEQPVKTENPNEPPTT